MGERTSQNTEIVVRRINHNDTPSQNFRETVHSVQYNNVEEYI